MRVSGTRYITTGPPQTDLAEMDILAVGYEPQRGPRFSMHRAKWSGMVDCAGLD